jgi:hypothetical protein
MSLLNKLRDAVSNGDICTPFTTADIKNWIKSKRILKDDGSHYEDSYIEAFASSSVVGSSSTKGDKGLRSLGGTPEKYEII